MNILGFNCFGHDSAASLIIDGKPVFAVEEERLNRRKYFGGFPQQSIGECLRFANLKISDLDHVTFFWKPSLAYPKIPLYVIRYFDKILSLWKESKGWSVEENLGMIHYLLKMQKLPSQLRRLDGVGCPRFKFHFLDHHLCHAASAFFCSPFDEAAILTVDGAGEWTTARLSHGTGSRIHPLSSASTPHSLGAFYQAISRYLGFQLIAGPGKLMGLSAYGDKNSSFYHRMKRLFYLTKDGSFRMDMSYFSYHYTRKNSGVSEKFEKEFGPAKKNREPWSQAELDIAAAAQRIVEDVMIHMANVLHQRTKSRRLTIAGGVGLNSVANGRLLGETPFKNIFIQPAAGDSGTSMGSALYLNHVMLGRKRNYVMGDAFLGPGFDQNAYRDELKRSGLPHIELPNYAKIAAKLLKKGKILGWFQGRLEFGPRALGNRSILANPCLKDMKDILNARVKFRESFRPFAPIVLEESCEEYFDQDVPSPYMLLVYNVRPNKRSVIPSVTHVDGSARVQTVNQTENPQMWQLLHAFKEETGVPVLLNTSFNIKGEPIVCTPHDAVDSVKRADIDYLVMGNFIAAKKSEDLSGPEFEQLSEQSCRS